MLDKNKGGIWLVEQSGSIEQGYICFFAKTDTQPAQIEASEVKKNTWYINRLIVPKKIRSMGLATKLLQAITTWADQNDLVLILEINAYGQLDRDQLQKLYSKYGFIESVSKPELFKRKVIKH